MRKKAGLSFEVNKILLDLCRYFPKIVNNCHSDNFGSGGKQSHQPQRKYEKGLD
jgi:hypothetical protein